MLFIVDNSIGILILGLLVLIGAFSFIKNKIVTKSITCHNCGLRTRVEQMNAEYCSECGKRLKEIK